MGFGESAISTPIVTSDPERKVSDRPHLSPHRTLILALRRWSWDISSPCPGLDDGILVYPPHEGPSSWLFVRYAVPRPAAAPVPVTVPSVPSVFWRGPAAIPSCLAVQGVLAAFYHAQTPQRWTATRTRFPTFSYHKPAGDVMISLRPAGELGRGEDRAAQAWQAVAWMTSMAMCSSPLWHNGWMSDGVRRMERRGSPSIPCSMDVALRPKCIASAQCESVRGTAIMRIGPASRRVWAVSMRCGLS